MLITISRGMAEHSLQERTGNITLVWHHNYITLRMILLCALVINLHFIGTCSKYTITFKHKNDFL